MALTPEAARRLLRLLVGGAVAALLVGVAAGALAWVPVWSGSDPSRDPEWWWQPSFFLIRIGSAVSVAILVLWWLGKRRARRR